MFENEFVESLGTMSKSQVKFGNTRRVKEVYIPSGQNKQTNKQHGTKGIFAPKALGTVLA